MRAGLGQRHPWTHILEGKTMAFGEQGIPTCPALKAKEPLRGQQCLEHSPQICTFWEVLGQNPNCCD